MKNGNNDIHLLEQQMANNEDICCSCGNITSFPRAFLITFMLLMWALLCVHQARLLFAARVRNMLLAWVKRLLYLAILIFLSHGIATIAQ